MRAAHRFFRAALILVGGLLVLAAGVYLVNTVVLAQLNATPAPTPTSTRTPVPTATSTATETPTPTPTLTPSPTYTPSPTSTPSPTATPTATSTVTLSPSPSPTATTLPPTATSQPLATPEIGAVLAPAASTGLDSPVAGRVWVGLYGVPGSGGLGALGRAPARETVTRTVEQALAYQAVAPDLQIVPFFHMVTTIADPFPGADGDYVHRVTTPTVHHWIDVAQAHGLYSVVDVQPGHSPITAELAFAEGYLRRPGVHLAVDPEFVMAQEDAVPGLRIGTMTGEQVNLVQAWLNALAEQLGERKVLVIHQFEERMFTGKEVIADYPLVDLVWDADGFGGPGAKLGDYHQYAAEPGFEYGGFKLFYDYDMPLMTPEQVLGIEPRPVFVVYQ